MKTGKMILTIIVVLVIAFLLFTIASPILIIAEDTDEGDPGIDMAAKFSLLGGFEWVYPGSSFNANGQTLHNIHLDSPNDPYGAARDIMEYTYHFSPHLIVSINNEAAQSIFGETIVDDIRANDGYYGYPGNEKAQGGMSRGDAVGTAMANDGVNMLEIPLEMLKGNIKFFIV